MGLNMSLGEDRGKGYVIIARSPCLRYSELRFKIQALTSKILGILKLAS